MAPSAFPAGNKLTPHPLAEYVPGQMSDEELAALGASIKATGQQLPIYLYEKKILDGRHRYKACINARIKPIFETFKGTLREAEEFVIALNLQRKSLSGMQKAIVGARMTLRDDEPLTQREAAVHVGASHTSINLAVRLLNSKNTSLIRRVEKGELSRRELEEELDELAEDDRPRKQRAPATALTDDLLSGAHRRAADPDDDNDDPDGHDDQDGADPIPASPAPATRAERKTKDTPAQSCAQTFIGLDDANKRAFIDLVWFDIEPLAREKIFAAPPAVKTPARKAAKKKQ